MVFPLDKISVYRAGTQAVVVFPKTLVKGDATAAKPLVAKMFHCDISQIRVNPDNAKVEPKGMFHIWRINDYVRPPRLRNPKDGQIYPWAKVNEIVDRNNGRKPKPEPEPEVDLDGITIIEAPRGKTRAAAPVEDEMVLVRTQDLRKLVLAVDKMADRVGKIGDMLEEFLTSPEIA